MTKLSSTVHAFASPAGVGWTAGVGNGAPGNMSHLNLNNVINAALVVGAVLSGFGLTARVKETEEPAEVQDRAGLVKVRAEPDKSRGITPPGS